MPPYQPAASKPLPRWTESTRLPLTQDTMPPVPSLYPYTTHTTPTADNTATASPSVIGGFLEDGLALTRWVVEGCLALFWPPEPSRISPRVFLQPAPFRTYFNRQPTKKQSLDVLYEDRCMNLLSEIPDHDDPALARLSSSQGHEGIADEEGAVIVSQRVIHPLLATLPLALRTLEPPPMQLSDADLYQSSWVKHLAEQNRFLNRSIERLTAASGPAGE